jgi:hypothetical protein
MKKLAVSTSILVLSSILIMSKPNRNFVESRGERTWVLIISPRSTQQHLDSVKTAWGKDSIDLEFSKLKYDDSGKLIKIKGTVTANIRGGNASAKFSSENLKSLEIKVNDRPSVSVKGQ